MNDLQIHHVGLVVPSIEEHLQECAPIYGGFVRSESIINDRQRVKQIFLRDVETKVSLELLEPLDEESPVMGYLRRSPTGTLAHVCYSCENLQETLRSLRTAGAVIVKSPTPDVAFEERRVCFLFMGGQVIELVER